MYPSFDWAKSVTRLNNCLEELVNESGESFGEARFAPSWDTGFIGSAQVAPNWEGSSFPRRGAFLSMHFQWRLPLEPPPRRSQSAIASASVIAMRKASLTGIQALCVLVPVVLDDLWHVAFHGSLNDLLRTFRGSLHCLKPPRALLRCLTTGASTIFFAA